MYLTAERLALANQAVKDTFAHCSVAWQTIPHWDTGDPSQTLVPNDNVTSPAILPLTTLSSNPAFKVTVTEAIAPTPDILLSTVIANTVTLAENFDEAVFPALLTGATQKVVIPAGPSASDLLKAFIAGRALVENKGFRAPACLITDTLGVQTIAASTIGNGYAGTDVLLPPANINSLQRVNKLANDPAVHGWLIGRRQRIAPAGASDASPGEEAVDLAVSICPSLEVVGEALPTDPNYIQMTVRIGYALRLKDEGGLVAFTT
jgi:hypothetical protein